MNPGVGIEYLNAYWTWPYARQATSGPQSSARARPDPRPRMNWTAMRKDNWGLAMDVIYVDIGNLESTVRDVRGPLGLVSLPINSDVDTDLKAFVWQGIVSYTVARNESATLDLFGGIRYASVKSSLDWNFAGPGGQLGRSGRCPIG